MKLLASWVYKLQRVHWYDLWGVSQKIITVIWSSHWLTSGAYRRELYFLKNFTFMLGVLILICFCSAMLFGVEVLWPVISSYFLMGLTRITILPFNNPRRWREFTIGPNSLWSCSWNFKTLISFDVFSYPKQLYAWIQNKKWPMKYDYVQLSSNFISIVYSCLKVFSSRWKLRPI